MVSIFLIIFVKAKMNTWFRYIILIISIFAIFLCKGEELSSKNNHIDFIEQLEDETECLSTDLSDTFDFHPSFINTQRVQKNPLRRDNNQRQLSYYLKMNKITHLDISQYIINKATLKNSTLSEPSYRLIRLGKLII